MTSLKKLAGQTAVYGLSTILGRFLNYLLTPLHTSIFPAHEFGIITELYAYIAVLNVLYTFGMETSFFRFATKQESNSLQAFNNAFTSILLLSVSFSTLIYLFAPQIAVALEYPGKEKMIKWIAIILASDAIVAIPFARIRLVNKVYLFAGAKISSILLNILLNLFFLLLCPLIAKEGWIPALKPFVDSFYNPEHLVDYVFAANLLANLAYLPFILFAFRGLNFKIQLPYLKEMMVYGFPILLMGLAGTVNEMFSRIMLKDLLPPGFYPGKSNEAALGIFGACYKLSVFMALAIQAFRFASEPFFFSNAKDKNAPELFARVMKYFVLCCVFIFTLVSVNIDWLSEIFIRREEYKEGLNIVPVLLMANLFMGVYFNLSIWYKLTDKTYWGTYITVLGALITIAANYILIPALGYYGSAFATFICYFSMVLMSYFLGQKFYYIPYPVIKILVFLLAGVIVYYLAIIINLDGFYDFLFDNMLVLVYLLLMFAFDKLMKKEL